MSVVFGTESCAYLVDLIASKLNIEKGNVERKVFGDGEKYYRIVVNNCVDLVDKSVFYVSTTANDDDLLELIRVGAALAGYGTKRRIFIIPFLGYSTMERAVLPGEIVSAKANIRMLSSIPNSGLGNVFIFMDLHVAGILHYFEGTSFRAELYAQEFLIKALNDMSLDESKFIICSADLGRTGWVESYAKRFNCGMAFIRKKRNLDKTVVTNVIGDVKGKIVIIYDDMCRSGGTLFHAADAYKESGAIDVYAVITHFGINNEGVIDALDKSSITKLITTNTHQNTRWKCVQECEKVIVSDITDAFIEIVNSSSWNQ